MSTAKDSSIVEALEARNARVTALVENGQFEEAIVHLSELAKDLRQASLPGLRCEGLRALVRRGSLLGELRRTEEALASYDEALGGAEGLPSSLAELVDVWATTGRAVVLAWAGQSTEALAAYREITDRFVGDSRPEVCGFIADALLQSACHLADQSRFHEALSVLDQLFARYEDSEDSRVRAAVRSAREFRGKLLNAGNGEVLIVTPQTTTAQAIIDQGYQLAQAGQLEEAISRFDEVLRRFNGADYAALQRPVARAAFNRAIALRDLGRAEAAVDAFDELLLRFGGVCDDTVRELCAMALFNKGVVLFNSDHPEEALAAFQELPLRYGSDPLPTVQQRVALALAHSGDAYFAFRRFPEALAVRAEVLRRFGESQDTAVRPVVDEVRTLQEGLLSFGPVSLPQIARQAAFSLADSGLGEVLAGNPQVNNVISIVDPELERPLPPAVTKELSERLAGEVERLQAAANALQAAAQEILSQYMTHGMPFALFLRNFDNEAHYARSSTGRVVITQHRAAGQVETELARALQARLPIVGVANASIVRPDFVHPIPKLVVPDDQWEGVVRILIAAADLVVIEVAHITPGVAFELEAILEAKREGQTIVILTPRDTAEQDEPLVTSTEAFYGTERGPHDPVDANLLLERFPRVVTGKDLSFDDLHSSPTFRDLLAQIDTKLKHNASIGRANEGNRPATTGALPLIHRIGSSLGRWLSGQFGRRSNSE